MTVITPTRRYLRIFASQYHNFNRAALGCIQVGTFLTSEDAAQWQRTFVVSAVCHGIRAQAFVHDISAWSLNKQKFDFDPTTADGLPWEVVAALQGILPIKSVERDSFSSACITP